MKDLHISTLTEKEDNNHDGEILVPFR